MADQELLTLADWQNHLAALQREKVSRIGATNVQIGSLTLDQKGSLDALDLQIAHAEEMVSRLGGNTAGIANARATAGEGTDY